MGKNKLKKQWRTFKDSELTIHTINLNFAKRQISIIFDVLVEGTVVNRDEKVLSVGNILPEKFIDNTEELLAQGLAENHDKVVEMAKKRMNKENYTKKELRAEIKKCEKLAKINLYQDLKVKTINKLMNKIINNQGLDKILKAL